MSFPTQTLAKGFKIIPAMVLGWISSKKPLDKSKFEIALSIAMGMYLFLDGSQKSESTNSNISAGLMLLIC